MHKSILLLTLLLLQEFSVYATPARSDSLLLVLDKTIKEKPLYTQKRERRIDSLQTLLNTEADPKRRYHIYQELYGQYRSYNMNSALLAIEKKQAIAVELQNQQLMYETQMNNAEILGIMGMYKESLDMIDEIERDKLSEHQWSYYYHLHHSLYSLMSTNATLQKEKNHYDELISLYKDSILHLLEVNTLGYNLVKNGKLIEQKMYDEALQLMNQCYEEYGGSNESVVGSIAFGLAEIYREKGDREKEKQYLAISAITDLKKATKSYIALRQLAILLYQEGNINRAYDYIKCSMEDALFCGARFRVLEISEALPIITTAYEQKMKQKEEKLLRYLLLISVLSLVLVVCVLFIWQQMKKLSSAKKSIQRMHEDLKMMNKNLNELNKALSESNHVKEEYICSLSESNRVKEEYICSIFNLCSAYINKMETYRIYIHKKAHSNEIDSIKRMTATSLVADEMKEFFGNFDAIFLNLYPKFIEEFNALLTNDKQILPKTGDMLTPELRVYALIRLGITDSLKIASFLHYSPRTVYNYTMKVRSSLSVSKDEFSVAMRKIG